MVSANHAARLLEMDPREIRELLRRDRIQGQRTPDRWEIPLSEIKRWTKIRRAMRSEDLFTIARAARELGVTRQAVHQKVREGRMRSKFVGTRRFVPRDVVEEELRNKNHEGLLSLREVSNFLGKTPQQVYQLVKTGSLKSRRIGYYYMIPIEEAERFSRSLKESSSSRSGAAESR